MNHDQLTEKLVRIRLLVDECLRELAVSQRQHSANVLPVAKTPRAVGDVELSLPLRHFAKKYAPLVGGGPKKFTLLVAKLVDGDLRKEVPLLEVEKAWNRMTSLMGGKFNRYYSQQAKENGWVETKKQGIYTLRSSWKEIIGHA